MTEIEVAQEAIDAMYEFWKLHPEKGAVQWLEDTMGHVLIFTRGEYRDKIMAAIDRHTPIEFYAYPEVKDEKD